MAAQYRGKRVKKEKPFVLYRRLKEGHPTWRIIEPYAWYEWGRYVKRDDAECQLKKVNRELFAEHYETKIEEEQ